MTSKMIISQAFALLFGLLSITVCNSDASSATDLCSRNCDTTVYKLVSVKFKARNSNNQEAEYEVLTGVDYIEQDLVAFIKQLLNADIEEQELVSSLTGSMSLNAKNRYTSFLSLMLKGKYKEQKVDIKGVGDYRVTDSTLTLTPDDFLERVEIYTVGLEGVETFAIELEGVEIYTIEIDGNRMILDNESWTLTLDKQ